MQLSRAALPLRCCATAPVPAVQAVRCLSISAPRRIAMADGGRAVDDIDLAFDYPSDVQATYTLPAGMHHARIDKEMGYLDQRLLYVLSDLNFFFFFAFLFPPPCPSLLPFLPTFPSYNALHYSSCNFLSRSSLHIPNSHI